MTWKRTPVASPRAIARNLPVARNLRKRQERRLRYEVSPANDFRNTSDKSMAPDCSGAISVPGYIRPSTPPLNIAVASRAVLGVSASYPTERPIRAAAICHKAYSDKTEDHHRPG
jgi:hypothetical protein